MVQLHGKPISLPPKVSKELVRDGYTKPSLINKDMDIVKSQYMYVTIATTYLQESLKKWIFPLTLIQYLYS